MGSRLESLTGLRFFAAFLVLQHHFTNFGLIPGLAGWTGFGTSGVSFFFVLSGFVLTWSRPAGDTARAFYWRRFARIWPLHALAIVLALPVFYGLRHQPISGTGVLLAFVLLEAWVPNAVIYFAGNPADWSLSCEAFFYALHPLLSRAARALRTPLMAAGGAAALGGLVVVAWASHRLGPGTSYWLTEVSPIYRIGEFALGVGLAVALRRGSVRLPGGIAGGTAALAAWFALYYGWGPHAPAPHLLHAIGHAVVPGCYGLIILAAAQADLAGRPSFLRHPAMVRLGAWSYALYLTHATVIYTVIAAFGHRPPSYTNLLWLAGVSALCVGVAAVLYTLVEHPLERYLRALARSPVPRLEAYAR